MEAQLMLSGWEVYIWLLVNADVRELLSRKLQKTFTSIIIWALMRTINKNSQFAKNNRKFEITESTAVSWEILCITNRALKSANHIHQALRVETDVDGWKNCLRLLVFPIAMQINSELSARREFNRIFQQRSLNAPNALHAHAAAQLSEKLAAHQPLRHKSFDLNQHRPAYRPTTSSFLQRCAFFCTNNW